MQQYEASGSGESSKSSNALGLTKWFRELSTAPKRGLVALGVVGTLLIISLVAASGSSDWESEESYVADMEDSYSSIASIDGNIYDTIYAYNNDSYTLAEDVSDQIATGQSDLDTHIDYFEDSSPPPRYGEFQENTLEAWKILDRALETLEEGYLYEDPELVDEGFNLAEDYYDTIGTAQETLPNTDSADDLRSISMEDGSTF